MPDDELKENLLKLFSLPLEFKILDGKRFLNTIDKESLSKYKVLASKCSFQAVKLLVALKKAELKTEGLEWECSVITFDDLVNILNTLLNKPLLSGEKFRKQVILHSLNHFNTLDIEITQSNQGNRLSILALDAIDDDLTYKFAVIPTLKELRKNQYIENTSFTTGAIQNDEISCLVFSYALAKQLRVTDNLHDIVKQHASEEGSISWSDLPPQLLRQAQSKTLLASIQEITKQPCNKKGEKLLQYFGRHQGFFSGDNSQKERNFASLDLYLKLKEKIIPVISRMTNEEIQNIIDENAAFPLTNLGIGQTNH